MRFQKVCYYGVRSLQVCGVQSLGLQYSAKKLKHESRCVCVLLFHPSQLLGCEGHDVSASQLLGCEGHDVSAFWLLLSWAGLWDIYMFPLLVWFFDKDLIYYPKPDVLMFFEVCFVMEGS